jgi:hypothetical protein
VAGSLDGRARRVRHLEVLRVPEGPPATSRAQEEACVLDAEIRALEAEIEAAGGDPNAWRQDDAGADISADLDEQIATLEEEIAHGSNASVEAR